MSFRLDDHASRTHLVPPGTTEALLVEVSGPSALDAWVETSGARRRAALKLDARGAPPLRAGDRLFMTGSGEELGDWDPEKGIGFHQTLTAKPGCQPRVSSRQARHSPGGRQTVWEDGRNRYIYDTAGGAKRCLQWSQGDCTVT